MKNLARRIRDIEHKLMGHIAIILGMGAILGQLLASSGGAASLGKTLVEGCGARGLPWALLGLSLLVSLMVASFAQQTGSAKQPKTMPDSPCSPPRCLPMALR